MSTPRRTHFNDWPASLAISFRSGIVLLFIAILTDRLWIYSRIYLRPYIISDTALDWIIEIGVVGLNTVVMCVAIQFITKISIQEILGLQQPSLRDLLKWGYVALIASSYNWALEIPDGYGPQYESELWFNFIRLLRSVLLIPIYEEFVYRYLIYGWLRTKFGRWMATFGSSFIFVIVHQSIHKVLVTSALTTSILFIILFTFSLLAAYLYETRRTLLTCVVIHAAVNLTYWSAPLIGYLWAGTIAQRKPPVLQ